MCIGSSCHTIPAHRREIFKASPRVVLVATVSVVVGGGGDIMHRR